jgi:hypothetical protein
MLVERSLVTFVNSAAGQAIMDSMGRLLGDGEQQGHALGTMESFESIWNRRIVRDRGPNGIPGTSMPRWLKHGGPGTGTRRYPAGYEPDDVEEEDNFSAKIQEKWRKPKPK